MSDDLLAGLNPPQRTAASVLDGSVLVLAGAGSGKTRLLTHRIAWMVEQGVKPWQILALTFTNKAAGEMGERVAHLLKSRGHHRAAGEVSVSTFHSTCARLLRRDIEPLGFTRSFTIYDADDQKRLVKGILKEIRAPKEHSVSKVRRVIDQCKNRMESALEYAESAQLPAGDPTAEVFRRYEAALKAANALDFNDLVNHTVKLWTEHPSVIRRMRGRYRYLLVDEYQDTNRAQYHLVRLLAAPGAGGHGNVMVVGDDDQSIYAFRGADIRNILDFKKDFPDALEVRLEQNYRSTGHILDAANSVVANNRGRMEKRLWTDKGEGQAVQLLTASDDTEEANEVVTRIQRAVRGGRRYGDIAIIYRTNAASRSFEQALVRARIPHVLVGSRKFYERREIRDLVSYLKLVLNPADAMAFTRVVNVPRRGVGPKALATIQAMATQDGVPLYEGARRWAQGRGKARGKVGALIELLDRLRRTLGDHSPGELVEVLLRETGYAEMLQAEDNGPDRMANVKELAQAIEAEVEVATSDGAPVDPLVRLQDFLDRASLSSQADELPEDDDLGRVTLLTAHLCKGLEFPMVFVAGLYEGGFPHWNARELEHELEEERRLVYVAMTRAQEELVLTRCRRRMVPGKGYQGMEASRFLGEIPRAHLERLGGGGFRRPLSGGDRAAKAARLGLSTPGRPVRRRRHAQPSRSSQSVTPGLAGRSQAVQPSGEHRLVAVEDVRQLQRGVRVYHRSLGTGVIERSRGSGPNTKLTVRFDGAGTKTLVARFAQLQLLE